MNVAQTQVSIFRIASFSLGISLIGIACLLRCVDLKGVALHGFRWGCVT